MHELIAHLLQESTNENVISHMANGIDHLNPISLRSHMLIEHHSSNFTKGRIFPLHNTILASNIGQAKLMLKT
jgi:hypothetical protein